MGILVNSYYWEYDMYINDYYWGWWVYHLSNMEAMYNIIGFWIVPLPRMPVTTRMFTSFQVWGSPSKFLVVTMTGKGYSQMYFHRRIKPIEGTQPEYLDFFIAKKSSMLMSKIWWSWLKNYWYLSEIGLLQPELRLQIITVVNCSLQW